MVRLITSGISLVPLYGYAYQVAIGDKVIATLIFGYNAMLLVLAALLAVYTLITDWSAFVLLLVGVLFAVSFAFLYPQYKYAFDSDNLWGEDT